MAAREGEAMQALSELRWDDSFVRCLPPDPEERNFRRQVHGAAYSRVRPTPVAAPKLVAYSREVLALLGLGEVAARDPAFAEVFAGNRLLPGMQPYAAAYGGHQFGHWAGQLGDGRAITLGEVIGAAGERLELQLKGAGPTPYSRSADGRAVMRSSVREFLCSEAMHHLGVPTTRALCLVATGEEVIRDMFYDGHARPEPGAIVCRVAPSFVRFGNFELFAERSPELLEALARYVIETHYPKLGKPAPDIYLRFFTEVAERTVATIAHWMRIGFVHGVMNTDNMSILGLTIDYGPYGSLDPYDPTWTPNTTDAQGRRYRYENQPRIALWNLARLASALVPLVGSVEVLQERFDAIASQMERAVHATFLAKLGLRERPEHHDEDVVLLEGLRAVLTRVETDMTIFFRKLADLPVGTHDRGDAEWLAPVEAAHYAPQTVTAQDRSFIAAWLRRYAARAQAEGLSPEARRARMNAVNPKYVLRNYLAQLAIDRAEQGDGSKVDELLELLRKPYDEQPEHEALAEKRPEWARHRAGCSMLSCSS